VCCFRGTSTRKKKEKDADDQIFSGKRGVEGTIPNCDCIKLAGDTRRGQSKIRFFSEGEVVGVGRLSDYAQRGFSNRTPFS